MHVTHLQLLDFRSYDTVDLTLAPGVTALVGSNGQGKTNIVEAVDYLARLGSHRVATDAPLVKYEHEQAIIRAHVTRGERQALIEVELNPGRANRVRVNKVALPRPRDLLGWVRTVIFSPEDLSLVKGDPSERRRFLDELLVLRTPRFAGVRSDYDKILKQRNALLKTARANRRGRPDEHFASTLDVWNGQLVRVGARLLAARLDLVEELRPRVAASYADVAQDASNNRADLRYQASVELPLAMAPTREVLTDVLAAELARRGAEEVDRGVTLVGPHRDELVCSLGPLPVKGYASHGESWSFALALRLASYALLKSDGDDPILILDDVFAELDTQRRTRLAQLVADAEQVLVTAAVPADVPETLFEAAAAGRFTVADGQVTPT
ncbi:MAG: DNA replication/repair protein RecF [Nocardioidaceae bacterium]|nr:MAG: DNA replication/repair protein RecF [Nocardioidaceae bacterium]